MRWLKRGLVYAPEKTHWWNQLYAILPTPIYLEGENIIRVYFSTTCKDRFGRVTFIDLNADNPSEVIYKHEDYILDTGVIGAFDDCGVNVSSVVTYDNNILMFYVGYQRHFKVPYSLLTGLAISRDGINFHKTSNIPILERNNEELNIRSAPTVLIEAGILRAWYVAGIGWEKIGGVHNSKLLPTYRIRYAESKDSIKWILGNEDIVELKNDEFGFGRPYIYKKADKYQLFYSVRRESTSYRIGFAESEDANNWVRKDNEIGIDVSVDGWDSEMICYPAVICVKGVTYLFYNGNNNGETGFGYAELVEE